MIWPDKKVFTIDIPKTACQTRWLINRKMYGSRFPRAHKTMSEGYSELKALGFNPEEFEFWTVVRQPDKRFVSSCNYFAGIMKTKFPDLRLHELDIMSFYQEATSGKYQSTQSFSTQCEFLDMDLPVKIWEIKDYNDMIRSLGWSGEIHYKNVSEKFWTLDDLESSSDKDKIMSIYEKDWDLYKKAATSNNL